MAKPKHYDSLTPEEQELYDQSAQMGDMEFEQELAIYMGDRDRSAIDADRVRLSPARPDVAGQYLYDGMFEPAVEFDSINGDHISLPEINIPADTVELFGAEQGWDTETATHEFRHRANDLAGRGHNQYSHGMVYILQAFRAGSKIEWDEAVQQFGYYAKVPFEEAEELMKQSIDKNYDKLVRMEATAGLEGHTAVPNPPENKHDEVGLLDAYTTQSSDLYDTRQRRITRDTQQ